MECCVTNPEITKVLIICDKAYSQKDNDGTGGVGDETVIISSEIYGNIKQEKKNHRLGGLSTPKKAGMESWKKIKSRRVCV